MTVYRAVGMVLVLLLMTGPAHGEVQRRGGADGAAGADSARIAQLQALLDKARAEVAELQGEKAKLQAEIESLKGQVTRLKGGIERFKEANAALTERLQKTYDVHQDQSGKLQQMARELQRSRRKTAELDAGLQALGADLQLCLRRNLEIYEASLELLDAYREKGPLDALLQREPVTQLKRVEIENRIDEYRNRLEDLKLQPQEQARVGS